MSTSICPPCSSTRRLVSASPSPVPSAFRLLVLAELLDLLEERSLEARGRRCGSGATTAVTLRPPSCGSQGFDAAAEIVEIIAHVALNVFTNYFNRAAETDIDFPKVSAGQVA